MARNIAAPQDPEQAALEIGRDLRGPADLNGGIVTEEITTILQLEPDELALQRDVQVTNNGGNVQFNPSYGSNDVIGIDTDSGQSDSDSALETARIIDYKSGHRNEAGIRVLVNQLQGSGIAEWGLGADGLNNKIHYREQVGSQVEAVIQRAGAETTVDESGWRNTNMREVNNENGNVDFWVIGYDPFDSGSTLGTSLDTSIGYIYKIDYVWYGQGIILFSITIVTNEGNQIKQPLVAFIPKGNTSLPRINLPIFAKIYNNGEAVTNRATIAGRQAWFAGGRQGEEKVLRHVIESPPTISDTSYTNIAVFRRKSSFLGRRMELVDAEFVGGDTYDAEVRGRVTLSGSPSYGDPNRVSEDPAPIELDENISVSTTGGVETGYTTGGGSVSSSGSGPGTGVGAIKNQTTAFVRQEPGALMATNLTGNSDPQAIILSFRAGV